MENEKCKICRRLGTKLFLKGERCFSAKCAMIKRPFPPGPKRKRKGRALSEYGKELREKQRLKRWYNLEERQFKKYVKEILARRGRAEDATNLLIRSLETRLDNVVFKFSIATSRAQARQLVSHGYFLVNGKPVNIPFYHVKKGDTISIKPQKVKKIIFQNLSNRLKKYQAPTWLEFDAQKLEGKILKEPILEEVAPPVEVSAIFEYYSR